MATTLVESHPLVAHNLGVLGRWHGDGAFSGTLSIAGSAVGAGYKIELYDHREGVLIDRTYTDDNGQYSFQNLDTSLEYRIAAFDHTESYDMVGKDGVAPS